MSEKAVHKESNAQQATRMTSNYSRRYWCYLLGATLVFLLAVVLPLRAAPDSDVGPLQRMSEGLDSREQKEASAPLPEPQIDKNQIRLLFLSQVWVYQEKIEDLMKEYRRDIEDVQKQVPYTIDFMNKSTITEQVSAYRSHIESLIKAAEGISPQEGKEDTSADIHHTVTTYRTALELFDSRHLESRAEFFVC